MGDAVEQELANAAERLVRGLKRTPGFPRGFLNGSTRFVAGQHQFAVARRKSAETVFDRFVSGVQLPRQAFGGLGDGFQDLLIYDDLGTRDSFARVSNSLPLDLAGPRDNISPRWNSWISRRSRGTFRANPRRRAVEGGDVGEDAALSP